MWSAKVVLCLGNNLFKSATAILIRLRLCHSVQGLGRVIFLETANNGEKNVTDEKLRKA